MDIEALTARLEEHEAVLINRDGQLKVRAPRPLPPDLMTELRAHKQELLTYLEKRRRAEEKAAEVARALEEDGWGLWWCELFGEAVAFIRDESFRASVPAGVVVYTKQEIDTLWAAEGPSDAQLRLIHEAKKIANARVIDFTKGGAIGEL